MKQADILKVFASELGTDDFAEINNKLKSKNLPATKFRISGKKLGHFGFTGLIKSITEEGLKVFDVNKVTLIKFSDIDTFEKAKPRAARPERPKVKIEPAKAPVKKVKAVPSSVSEDGDNEDLGEDDSRDDSDDEAFVPKRPKRTFGKSGSSFIPASRKKN